MYGLSRTEMEHMWNGMGTLTQRLMVWPDPRHLLSEGFKLYHIKIITEAASSLGYSYPRVKRLTPDRTYIREIKNGDADAVLKRDFSSQGRHVYTPHTRDAEMKLAHALRDERAAYDGSIFPSPTWFIQPYVAPLLYLGEVRVFIVNGAVFNTVSTTPKGNVDLGDLEMVETVLFTPLSQLRLASLVPT